MEIIVFKDTNYEEVSETFDRLTKLRPGLPVSVKMIEKEIGTNFYQARKYIWEMRDRGIITPVEQALTQDERILLEYELNFPMKGFKYTEDVNVEHVDIFCEITNELLNGRDAFYDETTDEYYETDIIIDNGAEYSDIYKKHIIRFEDHFTLLEKVKILDDGRIQRY